MIDRSKRLNDNGGYISGKMVNDLGPRKTMIVLVIVVGCFAVLWPKVFYPMLVGSANNRIKPSPIDRTQGCCDVISEKDVTTIKVMSEICNTIIQKDGETALSNKELISKCQNLILETCGIDISAVLQEQVRLGHTTKQILEEIRSLNGSLCLKYNFGVAPWKLGVPHRVTVKVLPSYSIKQERPLHLRSEMVHPAFRERGRAIPQTESFSPTKPAPPSRLIPKVVEGRPGPIPGMRPTLGGAGHVVPPSKHGGNSMGLIMPIYTIGIVVFFTYTVMKIVFKKQPEVLYPPVDPDPHFRREVFEADRGHRISKDVSSSKLVVNAMSALLDEVDMELSSRRKTSEVKQQDVMANGKIINQEDDQGSVQVLGMETTASCEGGQKWARPASPVLPTSHSSPPAEPEEPPQEIFLEGSLPPQSHLLVTDSATEAQKIDYEEDPAVVLAGKMTLSVISLDSTENGTDESSVSSKKHEDRSSSNVSDEFEKIDVALLAEPINDLLDMQTISTLEESRGESMIEEIPKTEVEDMIEEDAEAKYEDEPVTVEMARDEKKQSMLSEFTDTEEKDHIRIENAEAEEKVPLISHINTEEIEEPIRIETSYIEDKMTEDGETRNEEETIAVDIARGEEKQVMVAEMIDTKEKDPKRTETIEAEETVPMMAQLIETAKIEDKDSVTETMAAKQEEAPVREEKYSLLAETVETQNSKEIMKVEFAGDKEKQLLNAEIVDVEDNEALLDPKSNESIEKKVESSSEKEEDDESSEEIVPEIVEYVSDEEEVEEIEEEVDEEEVEDEENESEEGEEEVEYDKKLDHV